MGGKPQPNTQQDAPQTGAPTGIMHEVVAPDGTRGGVASADLPSVGKDYKITGRIVMYAPDGTRGAVDPASMSQAMGAGYRVTPETQFEKERNPKNQPGFWDTVGTTIANQAKSLPKMFAQPLVEGRNVYEADRKAGAGRIEAGAEGTLAAAFNPEIHQAIDALNVPHRMSQGRSLAYSVAAPALAGAVGVDLPAMERASDVGNRRAILAQAAVPSSEALAGYGLHEAVKSAPVEAAREKVAEGMARPTIDRTLRQTKIAEDYGHSPERAIVKEKLTTADQAKTKLNEVGQQIQDTLNKPEHVQKTIDVKSIIMRNARGAIADAKRAGNPGAAQRIAQVRDAMLKSPEYGDLNKSPHAAAAMKSTIYGDVKWTGAEYDNEVNGFRKAVASSIRDEVNKAVPEVKELNQRYGDIAEAKEGLERGEMRRANKGIVSRVREGAVAQGTRKVAQLIGKQYSKPGPGMTKPPTAQQPGPDITRSGTAPVGAGLAVLKKNPRLGP